MPREIKAVDVRTGDRIRVVFEGAVKEWNSSNETPYFALDSGQNVRYSAGTITLLDRPLPPIPNIEGTVIRSRATGGVFVLTGHRWLGAFGELGNPSITRDDFDELVPKQVGQ